MPDFTCPHCGKNLTAKAREILGAVSQNYTPYTLTVLCGKCDHAIVFRLEYSITLIGAHPEKAHA